MLTAIVAPTTGNLMAPETVLARLKLPVSEIDDLTDQVAEASGLVARYLRYRPEMATWQETFTGVNGDRLYLGARPAWTILSVAYRDGSPLGDDAFRLERGPFGESWIYRAGVPWGAYPVEPVGYWPGDLRITGGPSSSPDWTVQFEAGWWLEEMGPTPPAGVEPLPREIQRDFLKIVRWLRATQSTIAGVRRMKDDGAEVEFFAAGDQDVDQLTGIPNACTLSLSLYRRPA
jgi:hypothetical protein